MADNVLYYGDNLDILRRYVKDETVGQDGTVARTPLTSGEGNGRTG